MPWVTQNLLNNLRTLRALRPLRALSRFEGMRVRTMKEHEVLYIAKIKLNFKKGKLMHAKGMANPCKIATLSFLSVAYLLLGDMQENLGLL